MKMYIDADDHKAIALKLYRIPLSHIKCLDKQIDKLLKQELLDILVVLGVDQLFWYVGMRVDSDFVLT